MSSFTNRSNAARAARRLIETGEAPASQFEIRDTVEGRFEIAWQTGPTTDEAPSAKVPTEDPELAAVDTPRLITELARRGYRTALARRPRVKRQPIERRPSKATQLDEAAARGIMPNKPVITSATNQHYQKRFDRLAELAAAGKWEEIAAYEVKGSNTYAKEVARYRDRLLAAYAASQPRQSGRDARRQSGRKSFDHRRVVAQHRVGEAELADTIAVEGDAAPQLLHNPGTGSDHV